MALIHCRECGAEVSSEARRCPKCGVRSPEYPPMTALWIVLSIVGTLIAVMVWAAM